MPCMCGDTLCPSCGPAQGFDLAAERIVENLFFLFDEEKYSNLDPDTVWAVVDTLGKFPRIANLLEEVSRFVRGKTPTNEEIKEINKSLDSIRPCKKHDEWPDPEVGCCSCYDEANEECERLSKVYDQMVEDSRGKI